LNILILHHFETIWNEGLSKFNTTFEDQLNKYIDYILDNKDTLDKVIITRFEGINFEDEHYPLISLLDNLNIQYECIEYGYGWTKDSNREFFSPKNENITWCQGTRDYHTEEDVILIEEWMHDLKNDNIFLAGSFENECVLDIKTAFDAINVNLTKLDDLVVGTFVEYEFKTKINEINDLYSVCYEINDKYTDLEDEYNLEDISKEDFTEIKENLFEIEELLNNNIYKNIDLIEILGLKEEFLSLFENENLSEKVKNIIEYKEKFEDFSNINSEFNLITLKEKLENKNNKKTNKNKLIN
jgi:hypothetical protein